MEDLIIIEAIDITNLIDVVGFEKVSGDSEFIIHDNLDIHLKDYGNVKIFKFKNGYYIGYRIDYEGNNEKGIRVIKNTNNETLNYIKHALKIRGLTMLLPIFEKDMFEFSYIFIWKEGKEDD